MRVAYICLDPGIPVFGTKGASVHVQEVVRELRALGHEVVLYAARRGEHVPDDLAGLEVHTHAVPGDDPAERERSQQRAADQVARAVAAAHVDLVYERYSLFSDALAQLASRSAGGAGRAASPAASPAASRTAYVLEVNSPLIEEQREHRVLVDEQRAWEILRAQVGAATATVCVSQPVTAWVQDHTGASSPPPGPVASAPADDPDAGHAGAAGSGRASGVEGATVATVPNGVSVRRITPQPEDPDEVVVTFVGTLKPWHGVSDLLAAASLAQAPWTLRVIGTGPQLPALREQAAALGLEVDFRGAVAPQDVPAHLAGSAIGVAPYPDLGGEDHQYFSPLKVLEYLAAGLPVVASQVGQVPRLLEGVGTLVPPSDPSGLARAIDGLATEPARRARLGALGRRRAEERHSWAQVISTVLSLAGLPGREGQSQDRGQDRGAGRETRSGTASSSENHAENHAENSTAKDATRGGQAHV